VATLRPLSLQYSARAQRQLLAIQKYICERNPAASVRVGVAISAAAERLRYFPFAGREGRVGGTREWVVRGQPYILVYEAAHGVMILGVFHGAQERSQDTQ
jgi:toxin ParE1/3/4